MKTSKLLILSAVLALILALVSTSPALAETVTKTITDNTGRWTDPIAPAAPYDKTRPDSGTIEGFVLFGSGAAATVSIKYSIDSGSTWRDLYVNGSQVTYTADDRFRITDYSNTLYKIGVDTGNYTSGAITVTLIGGAI